MERRGFPTDGGYGSDWTGDLALTVAGIARLTWRLDVGWGADGRCGMWIRWLLKPFRILQFVVQERHCTRLEKIEPQTQPVDDRSEPKRNIYKVV